MSEKEDSENDIWEYKPLEKTTRKRGPSAAGESAVKRRRTPRKASASVKSAGSDARASVRKDEQGGVSAHKPPSSPSHQTFKLDNEAEPPSSEDFCPICQMPFSILLVQSQRWHVAECLDTPRDTCKECPEGLRCSSSIPNHYKKFNHTLLAHSRANSDTGFLSLSQQAQPSGETGHGRPPGLMSSEVDDSISETSQDCARSTSALSNHCASPVSSQTGTPPSKLTNGLLLLRSPGPEDFKKRKGWSSSTKSQTPLSASQERRGELPSTPLKAESGGQACQDVSKMEPPSDGEEAISYSPLSLLPAEPENEDEDSMVLFSSEDELFSEFIGNLEADSAQVKEPLLSNAKLQPVTSLTATNQLGAASVAESRADSSGKGASSSSESCLQSPQRIVLERLRDTLLNSGSGLQSQHSHPSSQQVASSQAMAPQKGQGKAGQASCLKQTDIGVFFGLKPLKQEEKVAAGGPNGLNASCSAAVGQSSRQRRQRTGRQRKTDTSAETPQDAVALGNGEAVAAQGDAGRGGARQWRRRRWNRWGAAGEAEELPRCPFYKKIPGTKFAVDAFCYGEVEGITAYFLTHFHSDHYGGLKKSSTFPIYCNRVTGNLVKSKLRVAEQYVHILPMNTPVSVEGARVILLDANHCPGAAMLLFFLPDGQTILHTGDFRADPSMETYAELLSCRVQTLYLDTTYCSPEYTFPRQQEVINFAASTAFELVTLQPRTLVVCGSYSVGKEKVFLALAEVLGSKVCLSRDKYNTMCCLESDEIKPRITTDWKAAQVHVLPMMQLSFKKLQDHLARFSGQYDQLVAFKPTGWTFSQQVESVEDIQPEISGKVSIYGIPYSEHSSFLELKRFVQWLRPCKIIPTVNNGSWASRRAMEKCFSEWLMEAKARL